MGLSCFFGCDDYERLIIGGIDGNGAGDASLFDVAGNGVVWVDGMRKFVKMFCCVDLKAGYL